VRHWPSDPFSTAVPLDPTPVPFIDLTVDQTFLQNSVEFDQRLFEPSSCAVQEGCVDAPGVRDLMRFSAVIHNQGTGDLYVGAPAEHPELFEYSNCPDHDHYHLKDFAQYLLTGDGGEEPVAVGHKQAFCLMDTFSPDHVPGQHYDCEDQGISAGWADVYDKSLDCQWVDITGVPAGEYQLTVTVDHTDLFEEGDETNNSVTIPVTIP
jgi:hypothetical protein